ncbi:MAG: MFS transporter [Rikenellaceae bacterium]
MSQKKVPFRKWVPSWLRAVVGFLILATIMLLNGAYTGSSIDLSSALGVMNEDINMAYYVASAGMATAYPLTSVIRPIVTTKTILLCDLILQVILSLICATTQSIGVIMASSFFIGFLKAFVLLEMIVILKPVFSKRNIRSEFYAYFYPMVFGMGQISLILTAELAYNYKWQYMYYLVMTMLLLSIILVLICFRYGHRPINIPFKDIDRISIFRISTALILIVYVCTYGKTDWFESIDILICTIAIIPFLWLFIKRQLTIKKPYVNFSIISKKAIVGYIFMAIVMMLSSSTSLVSSYTNSVLRLDNIHSNIINLMNIPGFILGAILCFWWFRLQIWRFRVLVFWGMACFVCYYAILYFGITPDGTYEFLYLPTMLKGMGMMILFIAFGVYAVEDMDPKLMISNAFFLVSIRSLISPVVGASLFSNLLYRLQQKNIMILGDNIDLQNPISSTRYNDALASAAKQGLSMSDAQQMAINDLYATTNTQALILSIKVIVGYLLIFSIIVMIISRFTQFHKTIKVKVVKSGDDMA